MATPRKSCTWREGELGSWGTGCDHIVDWLVGVPSDSDLAWCPYCGGKLVEVEWVDDLTVMGEEP